MPVPKSLILMLFAAFVSGCAGLGGTFAIESFLNKEITGDTYGACMARSYQAWARHKAWVQKNYAGAVELAERGKMAQDPLMPVQVFAGEGVYQERVMRFTEIAQRDSEKACACGNAMVEVERWSLAGPADDKEALKRRFDAAAAACEGR